MKSWESASLRRVVVHPCQVVMRFTGSAEFLELATTESVGALARVVSLMSGHFNTALPSFLSSHMSSGHVSLDSDDGHLIERWRVRVLR